MAPVSTDRAGVWACILSHMRDPKSGSGNGSCPCLQTLPPHNGRSWGLEFGWDELFRQLEAVRALQGLKNAGSGDPNDGLDGGLNALNAQRNTDYSLADLDDALQNLNLRQGTAISTEDVLEHLKDLNLSGSK